MKYSLFIALIPLLILLACKQDDDKKQALKIPRDILDQTTLTKVLTDFALAESAVNLNIKNVAALRVDTIYAFNPLKDNGVSKGKYDSTLNFYIQHPELYKKVYEDVLAALSEIQTKRDSLSMKGSGSK